LDRTHGEPATKRV